MDLVDILKEGKIIENSKYEGVVFGKLSQLTVYKQFKLFNKNSYNVIVHCSICSKDPEMYGEGYFRTNLSRISVNGEPCGCSRFAHVTKEQRIIKARRKSKEIGYNFLEIIGEYDSYPYATKCKVECPTHGVFQQTLAATLEGRLCQQCAKMKSHESVRLTQEEVFNKTMGTGMYPVGTIITKSDRVDHRGCLSYWDVYCPDCNTTNSSKQSSLYLGHRPCDCLFKDQVYAYIQFLEDGESVVAIKYGISNNVKRRTLGMRQHSIYKIKTFGVWEFENGENCKRAEHECGISVDRPALNRLELRQGYTETTWAYNLEKIIGIYESYGGVRVE